MTRTANKVLDWTENGNKYIYTKYDHPHNDHNVMCEKPTIIDSNHSKEMGLCIDCGKVFTIAELVVVRGEIV